MTAKQGNKAKSAADSTARQKKSDQPSSESKAGKHPVDEAQELDDLLDMLEAEDFEAIDTDAAIDKINYWHDILKQSDEPEMKAMAETLKHLKKSLNSKNPKPDEISGLLNQAGNQMDDVADVAPRGSKTKLHTLGRTLRKVGGEMEEDEDED
jgi:hypothetical protein